jgi:hypothetical protein
MPSNDNLNEYLLETHFCDFNNKAIVKIALDYKARYSDQRSLAQALFYFVRDHTHYRVGNWSKKASATLAEAGGTCTNNANLLVALLRATSIPAGYGVMDVIGPEYFGPIILPKFSRNISRRSKHVYCFVNIEGEWIRCDPSDDEPLSVNTHHLNPQSKIIEWNGLSDAMLNLNPSHIINNRGPIANIDDIIGKRMKRRRVIPVYFANIYIQFLREDGKKVAKISDLENSFEDWLMKKHFLTFVFYKIFFFFESAVNLRQRQKTGSDFIQ